MVSNGRIKPDPDKIKAIREYPKPKNIKELRSFLGLVNYCREFLKNYAIISEPLFLLLKGKGIKSEMKINFNEIQTNTFNKIKNLLTSNTERAQPNLRNEFILTTDASEKGIGAILAQKNINGVEKMISAFSRRLENGEKNYSVTEKELLGIVKGIEHYRHYLVGCKFILRTDHKALVYLKNIKDPSSRLLRWALKLQEYSFDIEYVKGEDNIADGCSRITDDNISNLEIEQEVKQRIMAEYHKISGHGSANNMKFLISAKYKWDGMHRDIEKYVNECITCLKTGKKLVNTKNRVIMSESPNELWEIDLIGRVPLENTNKFIFVAVDHYSKWVETRVLANKTSFNIIEAIEQEIINKHGLPKRILTDNGLEFNNKEFKRFAESKGIEICYGSPYHHCTTGAVERVNQNLMETLRKLTNFGAIKWDTKVIEATMAINVSFNRAIGNSPYVLKYGKHFTLDIDKELGINEKRIAKDKLIADRDENFFRYQKYIVKGQKQVDDSLLKVGTEVLVFRENNSDKLKAKWKEGYIIMEKIPPDAYLVKNKNNGKVIRANKTQLKVDRSKF